MQRSPRQQLLDLYELLPFHEHPLWRAILAGDLPLDSVLRAEIQHYLRTRAGRELRTEALTNAHRTSPVLWGALVSTYLEECIGQEGQPDHLSLIERLLISGGVDRQTLQDATMTPGNAAAVALYRDISARGAGCHILGAGAVEHYYAQLAPRVFHAYTSRYAMTSDQAATYALHGIQDVDHADRAFGILDEAVRLHGWSHIETSVRDAFVATSLHYDGMLQAAIGRIVYWGGEG